MKKLLCIVCMCLAMSSFAQVEMSDTTQNGTITINQDSQIATLVEKHIAQNKANSGKTAGWRIQIYQSSGTNSRDEAQKVRKNFLAKYDDVNAYLIYQPPFFKIRVGDFRTKAEAYSFYKKLLVEYPIAYLITDQINYPNLDKQEEIVETTPVEE